MRAHQEFPMLRRNNAVDWARTVLSVINESQGIKALLQFIPLSPHPSTTHFLPPPPFPDFEIHQVIKNSK